MKTWIFKDCLSRSPQMALKAHSFGRRKPKLKAERDSVSKSKHHFVVRRLRSQLKSLSKLLTYEDLADMKINY